MAKILVVEDNALNMKLAALLLGRANHKVLRAGDAESGLALARREQPDLILMDIQLPGMDGFEAIKQIRQDETVQNIPVVALTALAMKGDKERIRAAGYDAYVSKPIDHVEFLAVIDSQLAGHER